MIAVAYASCGCFEAPGRCYCALAAAHLDRFARAFNVSIASYAKIHDLVSAPLPPDPEKRRAEAALRTFEVAELTIENARAVCAILSES